MVWNLVKRRAPSYFQSAEYEESVMKNAETFVNDVQLVQRLEEHGGVVNSVAFYGNHLIASGSGLVTTDFSKSFNRARYQAWANFICNKDKK